ncbi:hypothetical protein [Colwellia sp. TT2012]|uniref:hypothetical protein n=1 Tax=Colwellia sp. TT2012 TaxID=1720342 RepID=UPI0018D216AD|nr:hypothetical protein [Colwellia sp. TT2012]
MTIISLFLVLLIGLMWLKVDGDYLPNTNQLVSESAARADLFLKLKQADLYHQESYLEVPTGVYLQSLSFVSANDVYINGFIWQTYPSTQNIDKLGVYFPEEVYGTTVPELRYTEVHDGNTTYGWYFEVTVRQPFDYSKYPLDHKTVWLRILSTDFSGKTLLIPDLSSYPSTSPGVSFGLDDQILLGNWEINETFFDYKMNAYQTNFGFMERTSGVVPELHFNVVLKRKFVNAFVVQLIPLLTVAVLLFAILLSLTKDRDRLTISGFSQMAVIGSVSALFFVVVISHVNIRTKFPSQGIVYIEYFYLVMYVIMMLMVVSSFVYHKDDRWYSQFFRHDSLLPKLIYWPLTLFSMVIISYFVLLY